MSEINKCRKCQHRHKDWQCNECFRCIHSPLLEDNFEEG